MIKGLKLVAGVLFGLATLWMVGFQVYRLSQGMPVSEIGAGFVVVLLPGAASYFFFYSALMGDHQLFRNAKLDELLAGARRPEAALATDVVIDFHSIFGFLFVIVWRKWRLALHPDDAREVLWQLHRENVICGWLAPPLFVVFPLVSWFYYKDQLGSIEEQVRKAEQPYERSLR